MRPIDGRKESNKWLIWWNFYSEANKARRYPGIEMGDKVRVMLEKTVFRTKIYIERKCLNFGAQYRKSILPKAVFIASITMNTLFLVYS